MARTGGARAARRWVRPLCALAAVVVLADLVVLTKRSFEPDRATAEPTTTTTFAITTTTTAVPQPQVPVSTALATPNGVVPTFDAPGGNQIGKVGLWYGYRMTMPVVEQLGDWLRIMLPERPNSSTAWVRASDVTQSSTTYRIVVSVGATSLTVYDEGYPQFTLPAGLGAARTPTPTGSFFVAVIEKPGPGGGYGPLVLDTSGHSEAIRSWEGSGDAVIAIHGPITSAADAQIGTTGTYISNGCIRLHMDDQLRLEDIPLGTPVDIVA